MKPTLLLCGFSLLLAILGFSRHQQPPPASPPYTTPPTFPEGQQMPPGQKAPPPEALSPSQAQHQIQAHFHKEPALANSNLKTILRWC
jgi:hypothetical protein